jgi:hypothetical protein
MHNFFVLISCIVVNSSCPFSGIVKIPVFAESQAECMQKAQSVAAPYANQVRVSCRGRK